MSLFNSFNISGSGMTAERKRMDVIANNIANANTTRTEDGTAFRRQMVIFEPRANNGMQFDLPFPRQLGDEDVGRGVRVVGIKEDMSPLRMEYDPGHPDADAEGYVAKPNVNIVSEMVDMITATRAYEANLSSMKSARDMMNKALQIGR